MRIFTDGDESTVRERRNDVVDKCDIETVESRRYDSKDRFRSIHGNDVR
jgi:hypothetical protein